MKNLCFLSEGDGMGAESDDRRSRELDRNEKLIAARGRLASPFGSGDPMSTQEVAEAINAYLYERHAMTTSVDHRFVSRYESGTHRWPTRFYREAFRAVLQVSTDAELGFFPRRNRRGLIRDLATTGSPSAERADAAGPWADAGRKPDDGLGLFADVDEVRRRSVLGMMGGLASEAALPKLLDLLMLPETNRRSRVAVISTQHLAQEVAVAKTAYQACRYSQVLDRLSLLLPNVDATRSEAGADDGVMLAAASADLYHVLGSVLLKLGDSALALVAAERSVRCSLNSHDPVAAGSSARIKTHALMSNGHSRGAVRLASAAAKVMERETQLRSPEAAAVYGALMLRGAIAAARSDSRDAAGDMLDEAARVAGRWGRDGNDRWTGFGPTNVLLHRVNVSLTLGDAGAAIALARQVPLEQIRLPERKASLFVDVAQAYSQRGRHEQGLAALRTAYSIAPQEIRTRPLVHRIIGDLATVSRGRTRTDVVEFAAGAGIRL